MSEASGNRPTVGRVTANDLRRAAEWADGVRGGAYRLSMKAPLPGGATGFGLEKIEADSGPADEIIIDTPVRVPNKLIPPTFTLTNPNTQKAIPIDTAKFDSIFWGEVSAEKFLVPYYVRFYSDAQMQTLRDAISSPTVVAIGHLYPTFFEEQLRTPEPWVLDVHPQWLTDPEFMPLSGWAAQRAVAPPPHS